MRLVPFFQILAVPSSLPLTMTRMGRLGWKTAKETFYWYDFSLTLGVTCGNSTPFSCSCIEKLDEPSVHILIVLSRQADRKVSAYLDLNARLNDITRMASVCLFAKFNRNRLIPVRALTLNVLPSFFPISSFDQHTVSSLPVNTVEAVRHTVKYRI